MEVLILLLLAVTANAELDSLLNSMPADGLLNSMPTDVLSSLVAKDTQSLKAEEQSSAMKLGHGFSLKSMPQASLGAPVAGKALKAAAVIPVKK